MQYVLRLYTSKNKFVIETLISFNSTIGILPMLILLLFNKLLSETFLKCYFRKSFTNNCIVFYRLLTMFAFSLIDRDPLKHRPIDRGTYLSALQKILNLILS